MTREEIEEIYKRLLWLDAILARVIRTEMISDYNEIQKLKEKINALKNNSI